MELSESVRQEAAILDVMIENAHRRTHRTRMISWWVGYVVFNVYMFSNTVFLAKDPHFTSASLFVPVVWLVGTLWAQTTKKDYIEHGPRFWWRDEQ